jgi:hypothetical protein
MLRGFPVKKSILLLIILLTLLLPAGALAQGYSFSVPESTVDIFWNSDGTQSLLYEWVFRNQAGAAPIDFIDIGLPSGNFDLEGITADVDGQPIDEIEMSPYVNNGVALGLGNNAIQPGATGRVRAVIPVVQQPLYPDDENPDYLSAQFAPTFFDPQFVSGPTDLMVIFHLPPGVQTEEPRYHSAPSGFSDPPESAMDEEGRIVYIWRNSDARLTKSNVFGASFPAAYVSQPVAAPPSVSSGEVETLGSGEAAFGIIGACFSFLPFLFCSGLVGLLIWAGLRSGRSRKMQYMPPKVAIEGHGIKRGLTAIEAAILMEQPVDKVLTMMLFSVIKKNAASVKTRDPLELDITVPQPEGLQPYEVDFVQAFALKGKGERRKKLQDTMVGLVKSVSEKMKGFSRKETVAYYQDIVERGWKQVESAETPEVKSAKYDEVMEWTMLDRQFDDRTRRTFSGGPVFVPMWWPRYDPGFPRTAPSAPKPAAGVPVPVSTGKGGQVSLPHLPGSDFAASMVNSVQGFSAGVIGSLTDFTGGITNRTNPIPKAVTSSSRGTWKGGSSGGTSCVCACACACAGCACACAGGGR